MDPYKAGDVHQGAVGCGTSKEGDRFVMWSFDSKCVVLLAFADDGAKRADLVTWWKATPTP